MWFGPGHLRPLTSNGDVDEYGNNTGVDPSTNLSTVSSDGNTVTTVDIAGQTWQFTDAGWNVPGSSTAPTGTPTPAPTPSPTGTLRPTPTDTTTPQDPTSDSPQDGSNTGSQPQQPSSQESGGNQQEKVAPHSNHVQHKPIVVHQKGGRIKERFRSAAELRDQCPDRAPAGRCEDVVGKRRQAVPWREAAASSSPQASYRATTRCPAWERRALPPGGVRASALVAVDQQRLGLSVPALPQQAAAQQALHVEAAPFIGALCQAVVQALPVGAARTRRTCPA